MERVTRVSQIEDDITVLMASYSCPMKLQVYAYTIRGVVVSLLSNWRRHANGNEYQLCVFPGGAQQWVNAANLRGIKTMKFAGGIA